MTGFHRWIVACFIASFFLKYGISFIYFCVIDILQNLLLFGQDSPRTPTSFLWLKKLLIKWWEITAQKQQHLSLKSENWKRKMLQMGFSMRMEKMKPLLLIFWMRCSIHSQEKLEIYLVWYVTSTAMWTFHQHFAAMINR